MRDPALTQQTKLRANCFSVQHARIIGADILRARREAEHRFTRRPKTGKFSHMKATLAKPEIVVRNGKPVSVIIRIQDYQELLERAEDAEDTAWLKKARAKPKHYHPLEEYLADRNAKRRV